MISNMDTDYLLFFVSSKLSPELHLLSTKLCRVNQISGGNPIHLLFCINAGLWLLLLCDHKHTHTHITELSSDRGVSLENLLEEKQNNWLQS